MGVMTTQFVSAAELMASVLGMSGYEFCTIDHPVSSASDSKLECRAEDAIRAIEQLILQQ